MSISPPAIGVWLPIAQLPSDIGVELFTYNDTYTEYTHLNARNMHLGLVQIDSGGDNPWFLPARDGLYVELEAMSKGNAKLSTPRRLLPCLSDAYIDDDSDDNDEYMEEM